MYFVLYRFDFITVVHLSSTLISLKCRYRDAPMSSELIQGFKEVIYINFTSNLVANMIPKSFSRVQIGRLRKPMHNFSLFFAKPIFDNFRNTLGIIILLKFFN
jgi:hypothetical protein